MKKSYDGIIGLALADAMGVPVEFQSREYLKKHPIIRVEGYGTYSMPEGCWSDDTSLTIATMDAIIENSGIINEKTYDSIGDNFVSYYFYDSFTPTDSVFDIGNTTRNAILKYSTGTLPAPQCGGTTEANTGNGALMRILPVAYYAHQNNLSDLETLEIVNKVASITHGLTTCTLGSYIYTVFARDLLEGASKEEAYANIRKHDFSSFNPSYLKEYSRILKGNIATLPESSISSLGKTKTTLEAALWSFMRSKNYKQAILTAINLGDDTDTVGACTGGLAGLYYGADSINPRWLSKLKKLDYLKDLCDTYDRSIQEKNIPLEFNELSKLGKPNLEKKKKTIIKFKDFFSDFLR